MAIPYADLPGFPHAGVSGHNPKLVVGDLEGVRVAVNFRFNRLEGWIRPSRFYLTKLVLSLNLERMYLFN